MGYTDQSGTGLWQHLTLALCCRVSCVVPIRNNNINNTHLCDSAVLSLQEDKSLCRTDAHIHPTFLCTEFALWKCDSVLVSSRLTTDSEMQVASQFCFVFFLPQMEVVYVCVPHASHHRARFASANVITGSHFAKDTNF